MPTDQNLDLLQATRQNILEARQNAEEQGGIVFVTGSLEHWEDIRRVLSDFRAAGSALILNLQWDGQEKLEKDQLLYLIGYLRDWDQLTLKNFLVLSKGCLPEKFLGNLEAEAKIENKWLREWWVAATCSDIHRYPGLPWRSYIRKIMTENFEFANSVLENAESQDPAQMEKIVGEFLVKKKNVVCIFPKKWGSS